MEKPKRPLSSFNLFYRYKRSLLVNKGDLPIETIKNILTCPAGLEDEILHSTTTTLSSSRSRHGNPGSSNNNAINTIPQPSPATNTKRRTKIQTELNGNLLPSNTNKKRRHRKSLNGPSLSFVELGKLMTTSWKQLDVFGKQVFDDLAGEGREIYRVALEEYNNSQLEVEAGDGGGGGDRFEEDDGGGKIVEKNEDGHSSNGESGSDDGEKVVPSRVASMPRTRSGKRRSSSSSSSSSGGEKARGVASMPFTRSSSSNHFKKNDDSSSSPSSSSDKSSSSTTSKNKRKEPTTMVSRCVKKALHERYYDRHFKSTGLDRRYEDAQDAPVPYHVSSAPATTYPSQEGGSSSSSAAVPPSAVALSNDGGDAPPIEEDFFERYADNSRVMDDADFDLNGNDVRTFFDASD